MQPNACERRVDRDGEWRRSQLRLAAKSTEIASDCWPVKQGMCFRTLWTHFQSCLDVDTLAGQPVADQWQSIRRAANGMQDSLPVPSATHEVDVVKSWQALGLRRQSGAFAAHVGSLDAAPYPPVAVRESVVGFDTLLVCSLGSYDRNLECFPVPYK